MSESAIEALQQEIDRRSRQLFARLASGDDAPPAQRLRLEGLREAAVVVGAQAEELQAALDRCHEEAFGCPIADCSGERWREYYPFPEIPVYMRRAPVKPSTPD